MSKIWNRCKFDLGSLSLCQMSYKKNSYCKDFDRSWVLTSSRGKIFVSKIWNKFKFDFGSLGLCQTSYKRKLLNRFWSKLSSDFFQNQHRGKIFKCQKYGITSKFEFSRPSLCQMSNKKKLSKRFWSKLSFVFIQSLNLHMSKIWNKLKFDLGSLSLCQMSYKRKLLKIFWSKLISDLIQNENRGKIFKCQKYGITSNLNTAVSVCVKCHTKKVMEKILIEVELACCAPPRACTKQLEILYSYLFISHWDWFVLTFKKSCKGFLQALKRMKMSRFC